MNAWQNFITLHLPTRKHERWKYADLSLIKNTDWIPADYPQVLIDVDSVNQHRLQKGDSILLVLIDGHFIPHLSDLHKISQDVIVCSLEEAYNKHRDLINKIDKDFDQKQHPFAHLNTSMQKTGIFLYLPKSVIVDVPIHVLSIVLNQTTFISHPKHIILLDDQTRLTLVEECYSISDHHYFMNIVNTISVGRNACLDYYKIQNEGRSATHIAHTLIHQKQDSKMNYTSFTLGGNFSRDDVIIKLNEPRASCKTKGFYKLCDDKQFVDHHIDIEHIAPSSQSDMLYKGILNNQSRAVFNGRLYVKQDAQKISAIQANHNLLLSNQAEIYSKPELEIYADDVKCKHGATTGQLDQDALFYLCSRGLSKEEAINLLLEAFTTELIEPIDHPGIKLRIQELMQ